MVLCLCTSANDWHDGFRPYLVDDAFYYIVIARHLAEGGRSTFDGMTLTNGYQPLWLGVYYVHERFFRFFPGPFIWVRLFEYLLSSLGLIAALATLEFTSVVVSIVFTGCFFFAVARVGLNGMEPALFICLFLFFVYKWRRGGRTSALLGLKDGVLATLTIGARLDSILFVIPMLVLAAHSWRRRIAGVTTVLICTAGYLLVNREVFGVAEPISGLVKSLGGLQLNRMALQIVSDPLSADAAILYSLMVFLVVTPFLLTSCRDLSERAFSISFVVGSLLYISRIVFLSSWKTWSWYEYPVVIGLCATVPLIVRRLGLEDIDVGARIIFGCWSVVMVGGSIFIWISLRGNTQPTEPGIAAVNAKLLTSYAKELKGEPIAMGDRAGEFAFQYGGGVTQLEGLVNDRQYFDQLRNHGDIKQLLCKRGIRYLVAYEPDLGNYRSFQVETIRRHLSQFVAPSIPVSSEDEIGRVANAPEFDAKAIGDVDQYLYLWRLDCR